MESKGGSHDSFKHTHVAHFVALRMFHFSWYVLLPVAPPVLVMSPVSVTVLDSEDVLLTCVAHGYPVPSVEWEKDGLPLLTNASVIVNSSTNSDQLTRTSSLLLASVDYKDAGSYTCTASNLLVKPISVTSSPAVLTVNCEHWKEMLVFLA